MPHRIQNGTALALLAYSLLSFADALVKSVGGSVHLLQIGFFTSAAALILIFLAKPKAQSWRQALAMKRPVAVFGRAVAGISAGFFGIIAFTRLPLSEAYSLMFLAPLFAAILGALILKERIGARGWFAIALGFCGVLLVVRPGFDALVPAHGAALAVALSMAAGIILLRTIAAHESRTAILMVLMVTAFLAYGLLCLAFGTLSLPSPSMLLRLVAAGCLAALGQLSLLGAASRAPASRIAPAQYCQLIWASLIGAVIFAEVPDVVQMSGLVLISIAGILVFRRGPQRVAS